MLALHRPQRLLFLAPLAIQWQQQLGGAVHRGQRRADDEIQAAAVAGALDDVLHLYNGAREWERRGRTAREWEAGGVAGREGGNACCCLLRVRSITCSICQRVREEKKLTRAGFRCTCYRKAADALSGESSIPAGGATCKVRKLSFADKALPCASAAHLVPQCSSSS